MSIHPLPALPCGADPAALLGQVADGPQPTLDDHQRTCPWCQAALEEFGVSWAPVRRLAGVDVPVPPTLRPAVLRQVTELAGRGSVTLATNGRGNTLVRSWPLQILAARAALGVEGVTGVGTSGPRSGVIGPSRRLQGGRTLADAASAVRVEELGAGEVGYSVPVEVVYGRSFVAVADAVRTAVIAAVEFAAGTRVASVDVEIVDVALPDG